MSGRRRRSCDLGLFGAAIALTVITVLLRAFPDSVSPLCPTSTAFVPPRQGLYVGVLSTYRYLGTRARAVAETWGRDVPDLEVFSNSTARMDIKHVSLNVSDDVYPPFDKTFAMMEYICSHHANKYDWFVRADDDVYIQVDRLMALLNTFDKEEKIYLGQPGYGRTEEMKSSLAGLSYCMGGPGVILSRPALKGLCPHLASCRRDAPTREDDLELGRCVHTYLGLQCTRALTLSTIFYHAFQRDGNGSPFRGDLTNDARMRSALTLHYAKEPYIMHNIHYYNRLRQREALLQELVLTSNDIERLTAITQQFRGQTGRRSTNHYYRQTTSSPEFVWYICNQSHVILHSSDIERKGSELTDAMQHKISAVVDEARTRLKTRTMDENFQYDALVLCVAFDSQTGGDNRTIYRLLMNYFCQTRRETRLEEITISDRGSDK